MNNKGLSLIIVIFALMLFAVLAWSVASMLGGNFDAGLRGLQSEQALYTAEAGVYWARNRIANNSAWRTSADTDCSDAGDWVYHSFGSGQYGVCCRNVTAAESAQGSVVAEVSGFVPASANYKARRELKLFASPGTFDQVVQANGGVFNWSGVTSDSVFNDNLILSFYDGNGNGVYNEAGIDYSSTNPLKPGPAAGAYTRTVGSKIFPTMNMAFFETEAETKYSQVWEPPMTAIIVSVTALGSDLYELQLDRNIFTDTNKTSYNGSFLRNITRGTWVPGSTGAMITSVPMGVANRVTVQQTGLSWLAGERVSVAPLIFSRTVTNIGNNKRTYGITFFFNYLSQYANNALNGSAVRNLSRGSWEYIDWGVITASTANTVTIELDHSVSRDVMNANLWRDAAQPGGAETVCVVQRYDTVDDNRRGELNNRMLWYLASDVILDTNPGDFTGKKTSLVVEGDIVIRGTNGIHFTEKPFIYPNLATKNGAIWSPDLPEGWSRTARLNNRNFDDVVYSENGPVLFNVVDAKGVFGASVTLRGDVRIQPDTDVSRLEGYTWGIPRSKWSEQ